jgi:hypothetical protein
VTQPGPSKERVVINNQLVSINFQNPVNLKEFIERRSKEMKKTN